MLLRQSSVDELDAATRAPLNETRFVLRRGRIRVDVEQGLVTGALELDTNTLRGLTVRPIDAELSLRWPATSPRVELSLGLLRIPFGYEVVEADTRRPFLERSTLSTALFPGQFDLGARLTARLGFLTASIALMNGDPIGEQGFPGLSPTRAFDVVGRLGVDVAIAPRVSFEAGVSGLHGTGFHAGTPSTKDVLVFRDGNQNGLVEPSEIQVIAGSPETPSETFARFAVGLDARLVVRLPRVGPLVLRAELALARNLDRGVEPADPVALGRPIRERGYSLGFVQDLGPFVQVGMRYDRYDPDLDARQQLPTALVAVDRAYTRLAYLASVRWAPARFSVEYDHVGNALGRDVRGAPTTLRDDALTLRGEVMF